MKVRSGFVSNSSSSSFIVGRFEFSFEMKTPLLTDSQVKKLEKYGFRKTAAQNNSTLPSFSDIIAWENEPRNIKQLPEYFDYNYGYEVICNQDCVIAFLLKNKIPFTASCHYDHETVIYDVKTDKVYEAVNFGKIMETYGPPKSMTNSIHVPIKISTRKEWLKNYEN